MRDSRAELVRVEGLVKNFPIRRSRDVVHAVNDVSFVLHAGETVGLVGESGSGKTTVGRCILRLIEPSAGRIMFNEQEIMTMSKKEFRSALRPRIQMVFQEPLESLNPRFDVAQILEENLVLEGRLDASERRSRVKELLDMIRLPRRILAAYPHELTGGEQQRVSIGRALSTEPALVVLDEPTSALDISVRGEVIRLLKELQQRTGVTLLFISHDLTAVKEVSERVIIMYLGEIVEIAPTTNMFSEQLHPYSKALLGSVLLPDPNARLGGVALRGEIPSPVHLPTGCYLHSRCGFALPLCSTEAPILQEFGTQRVAACHRSREFVEGRADEEMLTGAHAEQI